MKWIIILLALNGNHDQDRLYPYNLYESKALCQAAAKTLNHLAALELSRRHQPAYHKADCKLFDGDLL